MALFLVTCLYDEGIEDWNFRVVEATSPEAVAAYILKNYDSFYDYIDRSVFCKWLYDEEVGPKELWKEMRQVIINKEDDDKLQKLFKPWFLSLSPKEILEWIENTSVDGDSHAQMAILEITNIEKNH